MRYIGIACLSMCFLCSHLAKGQSPSEDLRFAQYLVNKKFFDEAIYSLSNLSKRKLDGGQLDSINYLLGNIYYNKQELENSIQYFDLVTNQSPRLKSESVFFSSFNEAYLKRYTPAGKKLNGFIPSDSILQSLKNFELAGINLLQRDYDSFDSLAHFFSVKHFLTSKQQSDLREFRSELHAASRKSPFTAGLLSAIIPGAGKFYAGYKGQGFLNFIVAGLLGVQAWEGYHKAGPDSFRFIAYASLFSAFYISNIWGSTLAVKIRKDEISKTIDAQILFAMHIPIRSAFH